MNDSTYICGAVGATVGSVGVATSITETQAVVSMVITILGFVISVLIPLGIRIYNWYKKSKADGKIDKEEVEELKDIVKDGKDKVEDGIKDINEAVNTVKDSKKNKAGK